MTKFNLVVSTSSTRTINGQKIFKMARSYVSVIFWTIKKLTRQLYCSDFKSEISFIDAEKLQSPVISASLSLEEPVSVSVAVTKAKTRKKQL